MIVCAESVDAQRVKAVQNARDKQRMIVRWGVGGRLIGSNAKLSWRDRETIVDCENRRVPRLLHRVDVLSAKSSDGLAVVNMVGAILGVVPGRGGGDS